MLKNHNHDLIQQLSVTSDTLWRVEEYLENSKGCTHCENLWRKVKDHNEALSKILAEEIGRHAKEGRFE